MSYSTRDVLKILILIFLSCRLLQFFWMYIKINRESSLLLKSWVDFLFWSELYFFLISTYILHGELAICNRFKNLFYTSNSFKGPIAFLLIVLVIRNIFILFTTFCHYRNANMNLYLYINSAIYLHATCVYLS